MQKWEYQHWYVRTNLQKARVMAKDEVSLSPQSPLRFIDALTEAGEAGWEVVGFNGWHCVLKRPIA